MLFNTEIGPYQVLPLRARVVLVAMVMKGCSVFLNAPASLEPHHQIGKYHIQGTYWGGVLLFCRGAVSVFYNHSQLGNKWGYKMVICARAVMVMVVRIGHDDTSLNPGRD